MARRYEYIIHGPPLSPSASTQTSSPRRTLHSRRDSVKVTNLRSLYRNSASPTQFAEPIDALQDRRVSSPTTPNLPPTPPVSDEKDVVQEQTPLQDIEVTQSHSIPTTPVNHNSPPTPEDTPPRATLKAPIRPFLALKPSLASTRAESFRTAREDIYSDDDFAQSYYALAPTGPLSDSIPEVPRPLQQPPNSGLEPSQVEHVGNSESNDADDVDASAVPLPVETEDEFLDQVDTDTPQTQYRFEHLKDDRSLVHEGSVELDNLEPDSPQEQPQRQLSIHEQVTMPIIQTPPSRDTSLRDRLRASKQTPNTASTEAFANVIGWMDENRSDAQPESENISNRWSGNSTLSAVEAYVVDTPSKPRKRGTLRKVVKNGSLRAVKSPIPESKRASLQSNSDSSHKLVHKKARLTNQNRWSTGSDTSRRSLSLSSAQVRPKSEVIQVAVIQQRNSSFATSENGSRSDSRSASTGSTHNRLSMPPVSTPRPRRKRAFSDSIERTPVDDHRPSVPVRRSSLSAPTSRSVSRAGSVGSEQFSLQRQQAEKDLRITLDRMESERLSASLRRGSNQSSSPTPASKSVEQPSEDARLKPNNAELSRVVSSAGASTTSGQRATTSEINGITSGSREWAELRPPTVTGTPFSQTSVMSTSPEIIEAKMVSFFPHNNDSLQLIEPNRLSESQAVRALKNRPLGRSNTEPAVKITTPRTSDHLVPVEHMDSPLRYPRKPPEPPHLEITPATPMSELNKQSGATTGQSPLKDRVGTVIIRNRRPSLQDRDRSESFIKQLTRNFSTRNAKNLKANQELDSTTNPFWRPRAFWDEENNAHQTQQPQGQSRITEEPEDIAMADDETTHTVTIIEPPMIRSNSITTGPVSLIRKISERKRQKKLIENHIMQQQALVKQSSFSSLQRIKTGRRLYGMPPMRALSLNMGMGKFRDLQDRMVTMRTRREDERREKRREALRKSIGSEVVSQGDSRFVVDRSATRKEDPTEQMMQNARAQGLV